MRKLVLLLLPFVFCLDATITVVCKTTCTSVTINPMTGNFTNISVSYYPSPDHIDAATIILHNFTPGKFIVMCSFEEGGSYNETFELTNASYTKTIICEKKEEESPVVKGFKELFTSMGLINFWLPLLIVFSLVFVALDRFLGNKYRDISVMVAFAVSIIFSSASLALKFVTTYLPYIAMSIVGIAGLGILLSIAYPPGLSDLITKNKHVFIVLATLAMAFFVTSLLLALDVITGHGIAKWLGLKKLSDALFETFIFSWIPFLIIAEVFSSLGRRGREGENR